MFVKGILSNSLNVGAQFGLPYGQKGMLFIDTVNNCVNLIDGNHVSSNIYPQEISVELKPEAQELLEWVKRKKQEDEELERLARQVPEIAELREKLNVMVALVKNHGS